MINKCILIINGYAHSSNENHTRNLSGGTTHAVSLVEYLRKNNIDVSIILPKNTVEVFFSKNINVLSYRNESNNHHFFYQSNILLFFVYLVRVIRSSILMSKNCSPVYISASHLFYDTIPLLFAQKNSKKVVYVYHLISEQNRKSMFAFFSIFLESWSLRIIKYLQCSIITDSRVVSSVLIDKYKFSEKFVYTSKNGVNIKFIYIVKSIEKMYDVCYCGRLHKTKGIYDLLEVVKILKQSKKSILCVVIGSGNEKASLESKILKYGLSKNFIFKGFVSEEIKIQTIKASHLFMLPSHEEGWGIVIGEALASGVPVIVYRLKEITSIWKSAVTWVKPFNVREFSQKAISLLKNDSKRKLLSGKGKHFVQKYDWDPILARESNFIIRT